MNSSTKRIEQAEQYVRSWSDDAIDTLRDAYAPDLPPALDPNELDGLAWQDCHRDLRLLSDIDIFLDTWYMARRTDPGYLVLNSASYKDLAYLIWRGTNYRGMSHEDAFRMAQSRYVNQATGTLMKIAIDETLPPGTIRFYYEAIAHEQ